MRRALASDDVRRRTRSLIEAVETAALLHDIGKLAIPDRLLHKPGPLTPDEYDQVKHHAAIGADMLARARLPGPLALIVRHHHENWDGSGYPDGLRRRRDSARRAAARDRRLLRRADLGSSLPPRAAARSRARDDPRAAAARCSIQRSATRSCASCRTCAPRTAPTVAGRRRPRTRSRLRHAEAAR